MQRAAVGHRLCTVTGVGLKTFLFRRGVTWSYSNDAYHLSRVNSLRDTGRRTDDQI